MPALWTIEIYYSCPGDPCFRWPERFARAMEKCLTDEHRLAILSLKQELGRHRTDEHGTSFDVYRAVLEGGVRSFPAFLVWLEAHRTRGIVPWLPGE